MVRYEQLFTESGHLSSDVFEGRLIVQHEVKREDGAGRQGNELALALLMVLGRRLSGVEVKADRVWFAHDPVSDAAELCSFFGCARVDAGRGISGMELDASVLDLPVRGADAVLQAILMENVARAVPETTAVGFSDLVRRSLRSEIGSSTSLLETVASRLRMAPRSLQRRLQAEGSSFHALADEVRTELSCAYLADRDLSIRQVALKVGYSEVGPFARAFRRWTGKRPSDYRESA
jgi:AraC-like DNA-binding protein